MVAYRDSFAPCERPSVVDELERMQRSALREASECEARANALEHDAALLRDRAVMLRASGRSSP